MKISYQWLQEYIEESLPPSEKIAEALTMHSFEIDGAEDKGDDKVFDIKVLPNRSHDCLSHYGIARELSSVMGLTLKKLDNVTLEIPDLAKFKIVVKDKNFCRRIVAVLIKDVEVGDSPDWLKDRLSKMGQRSINNIVDITNYVMFAFGQPMHAFNYDSISGGAIYVRPAKSGEKITLLNDKEYTLDDSIFVIADKDKALDIAGIIGGKDTSTYKETKNVLLVVDNFDSISIRKSAKKLGVRTESSARFENFISPSLVSLGLNQAISLINSIVEKKTIVGGVENYSLPYKSPDIKITVEKISSILGKEISKDEVINILSKQNIKTSDVGGTLVVTPPDYRLDLNIVEDIAEEVGRLYGYNNISPISLPASDTIEINPNIYVSDMIRGVLAQNGFSEIYTYALVSSGEVVIENPLASDKNFLRKDLSTGVADSLEHNFKYLDLLGLKEVKLFEIGKVFKTEGEFLHLCIGVKYPKGKKNADEEVSRAIHLIEKELGVSIGDISVVGGMAEIHLGRVIKDLKIPGKYPDNTYDGLNKEISYKTISPYPFAVRDLAVFVPNDTPLEKVTELIQKHITPIVFKFSLFDKFIKGDKTSYAFRLVFQSSEKTLTDEEINSVMNPIYDGLKQEPNYEIR